MSWRISNFQTPDRGPADPLTPADPATPLTPLTAVIFELVCFSWHPPKAGPAIAPSPHTAPSNKRTSRHTGEATLGSHHVEWLGRPRRQVRQTRSAKHLDRSVDRSGDVTSEPFREQPDIELRLTKTIVGRMLMNAEGTSRAQTQVADILIDMPSGASSMLRPRT